MRMRPGVLATQSTTTVPPALLYLIALESRLISTCFTRVRSALTKYGISNRGKGHADAALLRLRLDHGLAFAHDLGQRDRLQRQRQLARLDQREIEDFVDQLQQVPPRLENLVDASLLRGRRRRRAGFHELGEAEDRAERRAQLMAHAGEEIRFREVGLFRDGHGLVQFQLDLLAHGIVGADQQVADDVAVVVAQRRDRHDGRKAAAILADVGQLIDVLDPARSLEGQRLEARRDGGGELEAQRLRARHHFLRIVDVAGVDPVHDFGGRVAQHALGADVEQLDDALLVGGDDREIGAGEDRVLQGPRLEQRLLGLLARADVPQDAGEVTLAAQPHFTDRNLEREEAAVLAPALDLAAEPGGTRLVAGAVILEGAVALAPVELGYQETEFLSDELRGGIAEHLFGGRVCPGDDTASRHAG